MKFLPVLLFIFLSTPAYTQKNYSGVFGYTESYSHLKRRAPHAGKDESGYHAQLILIHLGNNEYRFWLYVIRGFPGYNSGHINGRLRIAGDSAVFDERDTTIGYDCVLLFRFYKDKVDIDAQDGHCGFGANVTAYGTYPRIKSRVKTADIADTYQFEPTAFTVSSSKAFIYKTADTANITSAYFIKNDKIISFEEEDDFIFVQHVTTSGKYVEGWIKKSDLE